MKTRTYDPTSIEVARQRIDAVFDAFVAATGIPKTPSSEILAGDRAFIGRLHRFNMTFATYDMVVGRASALWPKDKPWPEGIPRPMPDVVPAPIKALFDARMGKASPETRMETENG